MNARRQLVNEYLDAMPPELPFSRGMANADLFLNDKLADEQDRVQTLHWNKQQGVFDVKLVPHWSAQYCPFPDDLCACSEQGTTKIGEYVIEKTEGHTTYSYRKGYEDIEPLIEPSDRDVAKRWKELNAGETESTVRSPADPD
jgi:hypothetical protein